MKNKRQQNKYQSASIQQIRYDASKRYTPDDISPTSETFTRLSQSNDPVANTDEIKNQIPITRPSQTDRDEAVNKLYKNIIIKGAIGLLSIAFTGAVIGVIRHEFAIREQADYNKTNDIHVNSIESNVKDNTKEINTIKEDKKLTDYKIKELEDKKK